jgi:hypothetical protein
MANPRSLAPNQYNLGTGTGRNKLPKFGNSFCGKITGQAGFGGGVYCRD